MFLLLFFVRQKDWHDADFAFLHAPYTNIFWLKRVYGFELAKGIFFHCCCKNKNMVLGVIEEMRQLFIYSSFFCLAMHCWIARLIFFISILHKLYYTWKRGDKPVKTASTPLRLFIDRRHKLNLFNPFAGCEWPAWQCSMHSNSFTKHNCFALAAIIFSQWLLWSNVCAT